MQEQVHRRVAYLGIRRKSRGHRVLLNDSGLFLTEIDDLVDILNGVQATTSTQGEFT
jgi:hypothetical protein